MITDGDDDNKYDWTLSINTNISMLMHDIHIQQNND